MLTHIRIKNFKSLSDINFELGAAVVLIGPNNSGKTTALQALALWHLGLTQWLARRGSKPSPGKRPGVTINRNDLISLPVRAVNRICSEKGGQAGINLSAAAVWVTRSANGGIAPRPRSRSRT